MQYKNTKNFSQSQISQYHLPFQPNRKYFTATPNIILDHPELDIYYQVNWVKSSPPLLTFSKKFFNIFTELEFKRSFRHELF
jgi:hypothetical protein